MKLTWSSKFTGKSSLTIHCGTRQSLANNSLCRRGEKHVFLSPVLAALVGTFTLFSVLSRLQAAPSPELPIPQDGLGFLPADHTTATLNPPYFVWVPHKTAHRYELEVLRRDAASTSPRRMTSQYALYTPEEPFEPGSYSWRFRVIFDDNGTSVSAWSRSREFVVPPDAPCVPRPSFEHVRDSVPASHPRLLVTKDDLQALRGTKKKHPTWWAALETEANKLLSEPLPAEPRPWSGGKWNSQEWLHYYREIVRAAHCTETLAFAALLTGEAEYVQAAKKWLLHLASWDPHGTTSLRVNDEQSMHIMFSCARAYSWLYDSLTEQERVRVREMLRARAEEAYSHLRNSQTPYEQCPCNSHNGRLWHFLGEVAIALHGECPEATDWLNYAITIYYGWYPIWGGNDGGWAEGLHYFLTYHEYVFHWLWQLENVMGIPALQKPFYSQCGKFLISLAPPGSPLSGFGDFSENPPSPRRAWIAAMLAALTGDSHCAWLAEKVGLSKETLSPLRYLVATGPRVSPREPSAVPRLRCFPHTGLASYHGNLLDPASDVQWHLRASPLGNLSHSHCDQLAIIVAAFGDPLFVNTGFRDYFDSPFCREWYWHTRAHNAVLISGQGQIRAPMAKANILASGEDLTCAWIWADATPAYAGLATRVTRAVASVPEQDSYLIFVLDNVETSSSEIQVLWHTRFEPRLRPEASAFELTTTHARTVARLFSNTDLKLEVSDRYSTQPSAYPDWVSPGRHEWHIVATDTTLAKNTTNARRFQILTVIEISPRAKRSNVSHLAVQQWGKEVVVTWQQWQRQKPAYAALTFDTNSSLTALRFADVPMKFPASTPLEARMTTPKPAKKKLVSQREFSAALE